ncbi:2239_t:CDS:2, partial [Dentiscutata heterogama]
MQKDEELSTELVDLYKGLFILQTLEDLLAKEMLDDNKYNGVGDITELSNDTTFINLNSHISKKEENNAVLGRKVKIATQLPDPSDFNNLKH